MQAPGRIAMSVREQIRMSQEEIVDFLTPARVVVCATNGHDGWSHLMPLWYLLDGDDLLAWTYATSQKVRNLERDPRATLLVEEGDRYEALRGVMVKAEVDFIRDPDEILRLGVAVQERYVGAPIGASERSELTRQAPKRVGLRFRPLSIASFDHRKLTASS